MAANRQFPHFILCTCRRLRHLGRLALWGLPLASAILGLTRIVSADDNSPQAPDSAAAVTPLITEKLALASDRYGDFDIFTCNLDGSNLIQVTRNPRHDVSPSWSPDGTQIVFERLAEGSPARSMIDPTVSDAGPQSVLEESTLMIVNRDGSGETVLLEGGNDPTWSPDGTTIAFSRYVEDADKVSRREIFLITPDGRNLRRLTNESMTASQPDWTSSGRMIIYQLISDDKGTGQIMAIDREGGNRQALVDGLTNDTSYPAVAPNNDMVAFVDYENVEGLFKQLMWWYEGNDQVYKLPFIFSQILHSTWSPESYFIVVAAAAEFSDDFDIYVVNRSTGGYQRISTSQSDELFPDWFWPQATPTATGTPTTTRTPTRTRTSSPTPSRTPTHTPTATRTPSQTPTHTRTASPTPSWTATHTRVPPAQPSLGRVWMVDRAGNAATVFKAGTALGYAIEIVNPLNTVQLFDATARLSGPVPPGASAPYGATLGEWSGRADPGKTTHRGTWTLPWDAPIGAYTFQVDIRFTAGGTLAGKAGFMVTPGIAPCPPGAAPSGAPIPANPRSAVGGRVTDRASGQPIAGADVLIGDRVGKTNANGVYSAYDVATGVQPMLVALGGQADYRTTVVVMGDACVVVDVEMDARFMLRWPIQDNRGRISSHFDHEYPDRRADGTILTYDGQRYRSGNIWYNGHEGLDIAGETRGALDGAGVVAASDGIVAKIELCPGDCGRERGYGRHIVIDHRNGYSTLYGHLKRIDVAMGQELAAGQPVGIVGSTGNSTGPHLHFGVKRDGKVADPNGWFPSDAFPEDPWVAHRGGPESHPMFASGSAAVAQVASMAGQTTDLTSADGRTVLSVTPGDGTAPVLLSLLAALDGSGDPTADRDGEDPEAAAPTPSGGAPEEARSSRPMEAVYGFTLTARDAAGRPRDGLAASVTVRIDYDHLLADVDESRLILYRWHAEQATWVPVPTAVDRSERVVWAQVTQLGAFRLTSGPPAPDVAPAPGRESRLLNLSTRASSLAGDRVLIGGFIIEGAPVKVAVRAIGPDLANRGVPGALQDPVLRLYSGATVIAENDDWGNAGNADDVRRYGFAPPDGREAVILTTLEPGAYTGIVEGKGGATGAAMVEVFKAGGNGELTNLSSRGPVLTGDGVMIAGFIVRHKPMLVAVRALGPDLAARGVPGALENPTLEIFSGSTRIASNDDWQADGQDPGQVEAIRRAGLAPGDDRDAVVMLKLEPGAYTAVVRGVGGVTGVGMVEVFKVAEKGEAYPGPGD